MEKSSLVECVGRLMGRFRGVVGVGLPFIVGRSIRGWIGRCIRRLVKLRHGMAGIGVRDDAALYLSSG